MREKLADVVRVRHLAERYIKWEIGQFCLGWAYEQCGHLRIDTHTDNKVMQNLLKKLGFIRCGIIYVIEDDNPRYAFEKTGLR